MNTYFLIVNIYRKNKNKINRDQINIKKLPFHLKTNLRQENKQIRSLITNRYKKNK